MKTRTEQIILFIIIALAGIVRFNLLGLHSMHMDECLYSAYAARMVTHGDIGLNGGLVVDKPPLYFYFIAISFLLNGISANAARMPNIIFSLFTIYYIYLLAKKLYNDPVTSLAAAFFCSFSVFYTLFSVTAFQDISMILFFAMAAYYLLEKKYFLAGFLLAFSIGCKPMTLFLVPCLVFCVWGEKNLKTMFVEIIKGAAWVFVPLLLWSALLANPRFGMFKFFVTQQPEVMSVALDFKARFFEWLRLSQRLANAWFFLAAAFVSAAVAALYSAIKKENTRADLFLLVSIIYVYALLTFIKFRQFDRYLLVLVPFVSLALARGTGLAAALVKNRAAGAAVAAVICAIYFLPARNLPQARYDIGALYEGSDGFESVAAYLKNFQDKNTRLIYYGPTISWYGYFYLHDAGFESAQGAMNEAELYEKMKQAKKSLVIVDWKNESVPEFLKNTSKLREKFDVFSRDGTFKKYSVYADF